MQFIKIGDTIVNKNQIKYIEKGKDTPRFSDDAIRYTISAIFAGGDEWHYLDLYFDTEEERDKALEELFSQLNGSVQESVCKSTMPDEMYLGDDGFLKCKCDVCKEEMNFSDCYCYAKPGKTMIHGHKNCVMSFAKGGVAK